jgi:serine/threonine-protein kinase ATR
MVPIQSSLSVTLSPTITTTPFDPNLPTIIGFKDEIEILQSLQRPKKITVLASDGKEYIFLGKAEDDLRKDSRLMEFNAIVNQLLKKDAQARKRSLRTFY